MSATTLKAATEAYLEHLRRIGKAENTVNSYAGDLSITLQHFGEDKEVAKFIPAQVAGYLESDRVNKTKDGKAKNPVTVMKTRRAFRQFLDWCLEKELLDKNAVPESEAVHARGAKGKAKKEAGKKAAAKGAKKEGGSKGKKRAPKAPAEPKVEESPKPEEIPAAPQQ